jgi:ABC-type polysaccharide/polyol phosphate transport system ATPase subunit
MTLPRIELNHVTIDYPVYNADSRSLKRSLLHLSTGGQLGLTENDRVVVRALRNITCLLQHGDRVGLIGPNGAGKTTLLRTLAGVYEPVAGSITVNGRVTTLFDLALGMDPEATGYENIMIRGLMIGLKPDEIKSKSEEIAQFTELGRFLEMPMRTYSTGMALRLAFAVSTSVTPEILLMDEWIGVVGDASFVRKANERARNVVGTVSILVVASHSNALLANLCNRVIWLDHGTVRRDGPASDVLREYLTHYDAAV